MGFIISVLFGKALQAVFFGRLRAIEVEVIEFEQSNSSFSLLIFILHSTCMKGLGMQ